MNETNPIPPSMTATITREELRRQADLDLDCALKGLKRYVQGGREVQPYSFGLAGMVFRAQHTQQCCEDIIDYALSDFVERGDTAFKRFDYYDASVEFWAKPGTLLTDSEQAILWALGFERCWVCYCRSDNVSTGEEVYYYAPNKESR